MSLSTVVTLYHQLGQHPLPLPPLVLVPEVKSVSRAFCLSRTSVPQSNISSVIVGAELTDFVIVLNTKEAVKTFSHAGNITLGGNMSGMFRVLEHGYETFLFRTHSYRSI